MPERTVTVGSQSGLHAKPAKLFVQAAAKTPVKVTIAAGGRTVDARSMLGVLSLGVDNGGVVTLAAEGEGAAAAVDALATLLESDLDAETAVDA
jgi:phosphocarrier protein HPr